MIFLNALSKSFGSSGTLLPGHLATIYLIEAPMDLPPSGFTVSI